jgi:dipeptidyl aminopeptidase/acylaminoacyl peptidase
MSARLSGPSWMWGALHENAENDAQPMRRSACYAHQMSPVVSRLHALSPLLLIPGILLFALHGQAQSGNPAPMPELPVNPKIAEISAAIARAHTPSWAAISPDGATVAWTVGSPQGTQIHLTSVADPDPAKERIVTPPSAATGCSNTQPIWSPDGQSLAFTSTCTAKEDKPGQEQIFLWSKATGEAYQLTHLHGLFQDAAWSPDGKQIAFLFVENATRSAGALAAMKPWSGVIGEDGIEVQRIDVISANDGQQDWESPISLHAFEFGWAPNSKSLTYIAAPPPGENNWWVAQLYTQSVLPRGAVGKAPPRSIVNPQTLAGPLHGMQLAVPRFSPDGKQIAFIGGLMSDQGSTGGDIWIVPANGGTPVDETPGRPSSPAHFVWTDNHDLGIAEQVRGHARLATYDLNTHEDLPGSELDLPGTVSGGSLKMAVSVSDATSQGGNSVAFVRSSFDEAPEVWAGSFPHGVHPITHLNDGVKPAWGKAESIEYTNEGFHVQGWLMYPVDYDPAKKYPMLVSVHGGPTSEIDARWGAGGALYSAMGYFVFSPNPRGSLGQGETFAEANIKDFGYGDLRDILAGMDLIEKKVSVDSKREGVEGWSYGGFMTMFSVTQTHRFAAAVAGAGISDWKSYYGENSIDQWMLPFFGKSVYDDPAVYAKSSAIDFIHNVKTPTLVLVGDRDGECPAPQSFEFWHALRAQGTPTQLVVYPNEGHGFRNPAHIRDRSQRELDWFAKYMPAQ